MVPLFDSCKASFILASAFRECRTETESSPKQPRSNCKGVLGPKFQEDSGVSIMSGQLPWNKYNGICEKWSPYKIMCSEYPDTAIKISRHCHKNKGHKWDLGINLFIVKFGIELYNNCFMNLEQLEYISCLFSFPIYICLFSFPSDEVSQIYEITGWKDTRKALGKCSLNFKTNCLSLFF